MEKNQNAVSANLAAVSRKLARHLSARGAPSAAAWVKPADFLIYADPLEARLEAKRASLYWRAQLG